MVNAHELGMIVIRSIMAILVLYVVTRMLGKKQMSQLTIYDYVVGITIGSIAADSIISLNEHFINGIIAIMTFGFFALFISYLTIKNSDANKILNGKPTILMENGEFIFDNLRKAKIPVYKFVEQARLNGYYDLDLINYAILETNGLISFLPKEEYQNTNLKDFKSDVRSKATKQTYCYSLIIDGEIQYDVLSDLGKDDEWLKKELKKSKINDISKILIATIDQKGKIKIFKELI